MCDLCDYPVNQKLAESFLNALVLKVQKLAKESGEAESEQVNKLVENLKHNGLTKRWCPLCCCISVSSDLIDYYQKNNTVTQQGESFFSLLALNLLETTSKFAVMRFADTLRIEVMDKISKSTASADTQMLNFPFWITKRIMRIDYKQTQNIEQKERQSMQSLKASGASLREIAYVHDRALSTVQEICKEKTFLKN